MTDVLTKQQRSYNMSQIKSKNTKPEIDLRNRLFEKGLKGYRIHEKITGKPDIVFPKQKVAIFVDGCFWHKCPKCYQEPKTNSKFWSRKIDENRKRDKKINARLKKEGFKVVRLWGHEIKKNPEKSIGRVNKCLKQK